MTDAILSAAARSAQAQVTRDAAFLIAFAKTIVDHPEGPWLGMIYGDWFALCIHEVRQLSKSGLALSSSSASVTFATEVDRSRHSGKLLDDTHKSTPDQIETALGTAAAHRDQLINRTRIPGLLRRSRFLGRLQRDLSVVLWDGKIAATSLSIAHHMGLAMDSDPQTTFERAVELGSLVASFGGPDALTVGARLQASRPSFPRLYAKDAHAIDFFGDTFSGVGHAESMVLSLISCRLRSAQLMGLVTERAGDEQRMYSFKFRFAAIWQAIASMRKVADNPVSLGLTPSLTDSLRDTLSIPAVAHMSDHDLRQLRNVLVHYRVTKRFLPALDWNEPLLGLTEALCAGRSWQDVDHQVTSATAALLLLLDSWCGPFKELLVEP